MEQSDRNYLPPLTTLIPEIEFNVYGLASAYLGLQLRGLHYGVEEGKSHFVGLMLCYGQQFHGSPQVLVVESSVLPSPVVEGDRAARVEWSWANLLQVRECVRQLNDPQPREWQDEKALDHAYQEGLEEMRKLYWAPLAPQSISPPLAGLEVAREQGEIFLGRRFEGPNMLLMASLGLRPDQFLEAVRQLVPLQQMPEAIQRHQEEFEHLTLED